MDKQPNREKANPIELKGSSDREFFLLHGYTGSPSDFKDLPKILNKKFNADVKIIKMLGHGTTVEDLMKYDYKDFIKQIEKEIEKELKKGKKIVVGGYSLGALLALYLASKYPIEGAFAVAPPIKLKFPINLRAVSAIRHIKKSIKKNLSEEEKKLRNFTFYYEEMPVIGLKICQDSARDVRKRLNKIKCPVLCIFTKNDPVAYWKGHYTIERGVSSKGSRNYIFNDGSHNLAHSHYREITIKEILDFIEGNELFSNEKGKKFPASAVIPAFNEGKRIANVLKQLIKVPSIKEVIVVDDGSTDNTEKIVKKFKKVKYFRNEKNMGKAYSMNRGVELANNDVIFFCDADLKKLTPKIVDEIVSPVARGEFDMFIGLRKNKMQRAVKLFALNSGERAVTRELWNKVPGFYKNRFRIEAGLNYYARASKKGMSYKTFPYYQTLKEVKYGFWKGTVLRWRMNFNVLSAYIRAYIVTSAIGWASNNRE